MVTERSRIKRGKEKLTDFDLTAIINERKRSGLNDSTGAMETRRKRLLERYMGSPYGNERAGQSSVVTRQCLEAVEWTLPALLRIFLSSPKVAEFDPIGPDDEPLAAQETLAVNDVLRKNDGFMTLMTWIKDTLMNPTAYAKVYWEESEKVETEDYTGLHPQEAEALLNDEEVEVVGYDSQIVSIPTPQGPLELELFDMQVRRKYVSGKVVVEPTPPEELTIDGKLKSVSLESADFVNHEVRRTRSDLVAMGFDEEQVYSLPTENELDNERTHRRDITEGENADFNENQSNDPATELVEIDETYLKIDWDNDGIAELRKVVSCGSEILSNEEFGYMPFVCMSAVPVPHAHVGLAWQELVDDLQMIYTTLTRQLLNNAYRTNNPRTVVGRGVNIADLMNDLPNSPIRAENVANLRTEPIQPIIAQMVPTFEVMKDMKETRTGVSKSSMGLDADQLSRVADGAFQSTLEQANQRIEGLARIMAESGIKPLCLKIHHLLRNHQDNDYQMKQGGQWIKVSPSSWRERTDMTITVGLGTGNKRAQLMGINQVIQAQDQMMAAGSRLVTEQNQFESRAKLVEVVGLHNAEKYFTDPSTLPPPQPPPPDPMVEVQKQLVQVERQKAQLKAQTDAAETQRKAAADRQKLQEKILDLEAKLRDSEREYYLKERSQSLDEWKLALDTELEQTKLTLDNMPDLEQTQGAYRGAMYAE